jgi:hypothetical protein
MSTHYKVISMFLSGLKFRPSAVTGSDRLRGRCSPNKIDVAFNADEASADVIDWA